MDLRDDWAALMLIPQAFLRSGLVPRLGLAEPCLRATIQVLGSAYGFLGLGVSEEEPHATQRAER